ncbi:hypothetical protein VCR4J2_240143 [Vibrio coralliirubri]|nr:hypothetical protein VCR4J2_240143 [Vibrio coralliirubri]
MCFFTYFKQSMFYLSGTNDATVQMTFGSPSQLTLLVDRVFTNVSQ